LRKAIVLTLRHCVNICHVVADSVWPCAVVAGTSRDRVCGHVRLAPRVSTVERRPYYVQLRQKVRAAGAVASDGDLAAHTQIVGSEESTEERSSMTAVFSRCDVGRM
jgi:hypothetical protein